MHVPSHRHPVPLIRLHVKIIKLCGIYAMNKKNKMSQRRTGLTKTNDLLIVT